ncbi:uncharacterized protein METZ01_LOCUS184932 [marine metagenome]|uniref:Uncharacterized protein n=1 Tax=marine metagenome TaxID=408172 RepID=A0A382D0U0_9ZZZZ
MCWIVHSPLPVELPLGVVARYRYWPASN